MSAISRGPSTPSLPLLFVVLTFGGSIAIGVVVALLGMRGELGWGIP